jgi:phage regulator Rha-like protein
MIDGVSLGAGDISPQPRPASALQVTLWVHRTCIARATFLYVSSGIGLANEGVVGGQGSSVDGISRHFPGKCGVARQVHRAQPLRMAATQSASTDLVEVAQRIRVIRGKRVLLDSDLAGLYGVKTLRLNEQVRRNMARFPEDFLLHLSNQELAALRSQIAILKPGRGQHRKYPPLAFTEHGAVMAATILNSARAVAMSVYVVRAFVELRTALMANAQLARKLDALEKTVAVLDADSRRQFRELRALVFSLAMPPEREH